MTRHYAEILTFQAEDRRVRRPAHPGGVLDHGLQNRLQFCGRARDDPQDLARRGLLLERLGEVAVPRSELREQAHILNRDHRLVGEGPRELDLLLSEWTHLDPSNPDEANGHPFA